MTCPRPRVPLLVLAVLLAGCDEPPPSGATGAARAGEQAPHEPAADAYDWRDVVDDPEPPYAQWDTLAGFEEDAELERHVSDGGGRARLVDPPDAIEVGTTATLTIEYEAGPHGIVEGGSVFLQPSPFWGWSTPQHVDPGRRGYTTATTDAEGVALELETFGVGNRQTQPLAIRVTGRALAEGERIRIVYGDGVGVATDRYAERDAKLWIGVDGDGDGVRRMLADSPAVTMVAGPPARVLVHLPSTARRGDRVDATVAVVDAYGNAGVDFEGTLELAELPRGIVPEGSLAFGPDDGGTRRLPLRLEETGTYRIGVHTPDGEVARSNPMLVDERTALLLWADLHGHSNLSDGTGVPEDYFRYARDVAALDVAALTDHDHWGIEFLDETPRAWDTIREQVRAFHEPGRFVTLLGYEWTSWIHGHRHVLYFSDDGEVHSSVDPQTTTPRQLWDALRGQPAMTFAHHSAGGPIPVNWSFAPDPELEPVTEIMSVHGSSEALDSPRRIYSPQPGWFVRDVLDHGYRYGFIGSGDSHDGHPGLAHLASPHGGLAGIYAAERTRQAVREALAARRVYATSGARIVLLTALGDAIMGSTVSSEAIGGRGELAVDVVGTGPIETVELIRSGRRADRVDAEGREEISLSWTLEELAPDEYLYVRVVQADQHLAWSSPIFVDP